MFRTKRIYRDPSPDDGYRVLVDRLWPRGVSREDAELDEWMREIAPSDEARNLLHDDGDWGSFRENYRRELEEKENLLSELLELEDE